MVRILCIFGVFLFTSSVGQTFQNIRKRVDEDKIIIIYDLVSLDLGSRIKVSLFSSHNNFESPLQNVTGDIGLVLPGPNRRITWTAGELVKSADSLSFEFKGEIVYRLKLLSPASNSKIKKGELNTIQWLGGLATDTVTISLVKPNNETQELAQTFNRGSFNWMVPKNLKASKGYSIKIASNIYTIEERFTIKRSVPRIWFIIPVAGVLVALLSGDGGGDDGLPDAPSPN